MIELVIPFSLHLKTNVCRLRNAHFIINDIGMCFHFAIATKEIVEACHCVAKLKAIKSSIRFTAEPGHGISSTIYLVN